MSAERVRNALVAPGGLWREIRIVAETGSTNSDLLADARGVVAEVVVLAAEPHSPARGRMARQWVAPPRAALTFSVLLRPGAVPQARRGWITLLAGVALALALRQEAGVDARLKWPNDVQVNGAKLAGILAEQAEDAIVVGAGINVSTRRDELPVPGATSLALAGAAVTDRDRLLAGVLRELERWYLDWAGRAGDAGATGLAAEYRRLSATLGRQVAVSLPGGRTLTGSADDVDDLGRLVVGSAEGPVPVSAGDVVHVR
jgi:BirA family transcriptional regulator, biotin operon repressor / biotin---[acetyl-CoA-carboxylase] ligase